MGIPVWGQLATATSNYDYGTDEYVTVNKGTSPDGKWGIATHGEGEMGYGHFHAYLFDATSGKKIGPLEEITDTLDTEAGAFAAKWSKDSKTVSIVYRVSRHAPLKGMTYHVVKGRAIPAAKRPVNLDDDGVLAVFWRNLPDENHPEKTYGKPKEPSGEH